MNLDLFAFSKTDKKVLLCNFNAIKNVDTITLIEDFEEKEMVLQLIKSRITIHPNFELKIQNLLKLNDGHTAFYIVQLLLDEFFNLDDEDSRAINRTYSFHVFGLAKTSFNIENLTIFPKQKTKDVMAQFFTQEFKLGASESFNKKYYCKTESIEKAKNLLSETALDEIAKHNLVLNIMDDFVFISFSNKMQQNQSSIVRNVFQKMNGLVKF